MKKHTIAELNTLYDEAESVDKEVFAEMRSNVLLLAGEHYKKRDHGSITREANRANDRFQLRLVKNHLHKINRYYGTSLASATGVAVSPQIDSDLQDTKDAELNQAVYNQHVIDYRLKERYRQWAFNFPAVGELATMIRWNPNAGEIVGYAQKFNEETGEPEFDPNGQPVGDENNPVFEGKFEIEDIFPANLFRDPTAKNMRDSSLIGVRKMVATKLLQERYKDDPEKIKGLESSSKEDFVVFDQARSSYGKSKNEVLVKEFYFRPCTEYPEGYFYITAGQTILEEGPLPFGLFPIVWAGFDELPTTPRARSIIKLARPYVAEINRASSQMAMHQITIGDDKVIYQKGAKLEQGALLPGIRGISFQGMKAPQILQGRDGSQFLGYIQQQIAELYQVVMVDEISEEKLTQMDPTSLLFRAASQRMKFGVYIEKFEQYLIDFVTLLLDYSRHYLPDTAVVPAIGRGELINLAEFRKTSKIRHMIKVEAREDTLDSLVGRQMNFQNTLQYVGKQLEREDIGKIMVNAPYANKEAFADFTLDDQNAKNDMLAMERGEYPPIGRSDDPAKMLKKLETRTRKPDYKFLDPRVQQLYEKRIQDYTVLQAQQQEKILAAQAEYIPMDGPMVQCDMYVQNPNDPNAAAQRAMFPQNALVALQKRLEAQGINLMSLKPLSPPTLANIAEQVNNGRGPGGAMLPPPAMQNGGSLPIGQVG